MRGAIRVVVGMCVPLGLSAALSGCDRLTGGKTAEADNLRADPKRQQAACASASAVSGVKNAIFDAAVQARGSDRTNLDILADYSAVRMEQPVVRDWDRSLDITHCTARFVLDVPPGAQKGLGGKRQLQADIDYTAQASADGTGLVYKQKGAEPIVAELARFNVGPGAFRPPPAIDQPATVLAEQQTPVPQAETALTPPTGTPAPRPHSVSTAPARPAAVPNREPAERRSLETRSPGSGTEDSRRGEATVRAFYSALGAGNGAAASSQVIRRKDLAVHFPPEQCLDSMDGCRSRLGLLRSSLPEMALTGSGIDTPLAGPAAMGAQW